MTSRVVAVAPLAVPPSGCFEIPASKSHALRVLALAGRGAPCILHMTMPPCADIAAMVMALRALGADIEFGGAALHVHRSVDVAATEPISIDAGDGAAPARFLMALAATLVRPVTITGQGRLPRRPFGPLVTALRELGAAVSADDGLPLTVQGPMRGGGVRLSSEVSSQFTSALLLAAPWCSEGMVIQQVTALGSHPYVRLTESVLKEFGIAALRSGTEIQVAGRPPAAVLRRLFCEGDWSGAAFLLGIAAAHDGDVEVAGLSWPSMQPDAALVGILRTMGCRVTLDLDSPPAERSAEPRVQPALSNPTPHSSRVLLRCGGAVQRGFDCDLRGTPDLAPPLVAIAACRPFSSVFRGLGVLRHKESDRLDGLRRLLSAFGVEHACEGDTLTVRGRVPAGGPVGWNPAGDHRMAMAAALLGLARSVRIDDAECVTKSFPRFFEQWPGTEKH